VNAYLLGHIQLREHKRLYLYMQFRKVRLHGTLLRFTMLRQWKKSAIRDLRAQEMSQLREAYLSQKDKIERQRDRTVVLSVNAWFQSK